PRREAPLFRAIAADLHFAPTTAVVLAPVIEQPTASVAAAFPNAMKISHSEQRHRRERDRTKGRFDRRGADAPTPPARCNAWRQRRPSDKSRLQSRKTGERSLRRPRAA